ncbi:MAG: 1-acyl-sn-glycerol-3-phosphate acyltransferase [Sandaracinaceae bacterium]|jgi:1-acyl-sn-glycerol-3-phosphate acyltransferase|nr:1-acyl-sn-glycerol-3-phosphate acyltransferase [Sandaracinaceae bacterium]MBK7153110.1 1-acyl-sn-glycerol-3-phosphate acyltransferase [Sandaracinaceae bacterium]MBK7773442.1 1-acyl-sn-glycerol-3-phosphate acyltransferase [Sandaracinaceae bacterium]MBK8589086.1 1-acyl-sn-glycerol-3-phosphate acyltransferase [Sandaracinaceae bacterium]
MLNLALYQQTRLQPRPLAHRAIADGFLRHEYRRKVALRVVGLERIPEGPVIYAMNHTDAFNYWPFQYALHRAAERYTAAWVKGKNYDGFVASRFMRWTNNIPLASRGYVITRDFVSTVGRLPSADEYRVLRSAVDGAGPIEGSVPKVLLTRGRDMLGRWFDASRETYPEAVTGLMSELMARFVALNHHAIERLGLDVLVFPQGSRSRRLSRGHIGLAQVALHLGATIVPVGCSGSDEVYDSRSVIAKPGAITYRVGKPIRAAHWAAIGPKEPFVPFSHAAETQHRSAFQTVVDEVMERIDELVDEPYRFTDNRCSDGTAGSARFV